MDFQKLAVCSTMLATSDSTSAEHLRPEEKGDIKMAISQPGQFSAKMNLTFRSNALLRTARLDNYLFLCCTSDQSFELFFGFQNNWTVN